LEIGLIASSSSGHPQPTSRETGTRALAALGDKGAAQEARATFDGVFADVHLAPAASKGSDKKYEVLKCVCINNFKKIIMDANMGFDPRF